MLAPVRMLTAVVEHGRLAAAALSKANFSTHRRHAWSHKPTPAEDLLHDLAVDSTLDVKPFFLPAASLG